MPVCCPVCHAENPRLLIQDRFEKRNRYFRCKICGSGFSLMRVQDLSEAADVHTAEYYAEEKQPVRTVSAAEAHFMERLLHFRPGGRLLDVGCGTGEWLRYIRQHSSFQVEGVEPSKEAAAHARDTHGIPVIPGDLASASFPNETFDVVYLRHVLEHITAPDELLAEIHRILKPEGICVIHVPNDASITNFLKRFLYRAGLIKEFGSLFYPLHVTGFTPQSLERLFSSRGFRQLARETISKTQRTYEFALTPLDIPLLPGAFLERILGKGNLLVGWYEKE